MKVDILTYCDFANVYGTKLCIMGATDIVFVPQFPAKIPYAFVAIKMRQEIEDQGEKPIRTEIIDQDMNLIISAGSRTLKFVDTKSDRPIRITTFLHLDRFGSFQISKPGEYILRVLLSGAQVAAVPLYFYPPPKKPAVG